MSGTNVKRSLIKSFLNTGTPSSPVWSLIGDGITTAAIKYSPETLDETYIHQDSASIDVESYKPTLPVKANVKPGDAAFNYVDNLRMHRSILADARTEIVNVWLYTTPTLNQYSAERQTVSIQIDDFGGDGGKTATINYTINFVGDPILGTFNPLTLAFTAVPNLAGLASLVFGSGPLVLAPVFNTSQLFYTTTSSNNSDTITATAANTGSTIVIKNGVTTVTNGAAATWTTGTNVVTVTVTNGSEVVVYTINVVH